MIGRVENLGSRTGLQLPLHSGCNRFTHRGAAARFGNDPG